MTAHAWAPMLREKSAQYKERIRIKTALCKSIPLYGECRCIRENDRGFKVGRIYPFQYQAGEYVRSRSTIIVDDPPCWDWVFSHNEEEFHTYFEILIL